MKLATTRTPGRLAPKTPVMQRQLSDGATDPVQVYCRIRPLQSSNEQLCVEVLTPRTIVLRPPETASNYKIAGLREMQYTFKQVFDKDSTQSETYAKVAQPLVEGLIKGKNGLLFTYGVTSSGKTYTMTGNTENRGIMPRCLEVLFKTISDYQTKKFVFKPDKMNGFEILSDADAMLERQHELNAKYGKLGNRKNSDPEIASRASTDVSRLDGINEDNMYAVFITYIEVYNNSVYDLLEDGPISKNLQTKIIRGDERQNMYVHGVTEVEVKSVSEAIDAYHMGQKRKRTGHTILNSESSRSHSVFTIRLVQAPTDRRGEELIQDRRKITVSQLSLVDLAGSERTNRTKNTGQRLREAGNINNSLMTLRQCLEILRENQNTNAQKKVPYRDAKITHLFKNYFDGEGQVRMIVCINPRCEDYDETTQVMKFAEMTQEVQVARPTPMKLDYGMTPGRRKANQIFKMAVNKMEENGRIEARKLDVDIGLVYSLGPKFPDFNIDPEQAGKLVGELIQLLDQRIQKRTTLIEDYSARQDSFRMKLVQMERDFLNLKSENAQLQSMLNLERERAGVHVRKIESMESINDESIRKIRDREIQIRELQKELNEMRYRLNQKDLEQEKQKKKYSKNYAAQNEKWSREMDTKLRAQKDQYQDGIRSSEQIVNNVKACINSTYAPGKENNVRDIPVTPARTTSRPVTTQQFFTPRAHRGVVVTNARHRRSKLTDGTWLEQRPPNTVSTGTILQPYYTKRKSITKPDAKAITSSKTSNYCLIDQVADSDGGVETHLIKGDIIRTDTGAQVVFNDIECLRQSSPGASQRKRPSDHEPCLSPGDAELTARCSVGIQGSSKRSKL